jgi:D-alanyl-D-alanine carboxypeptidase (penicillin-binding protein 5/6)
MKYALRYPKLKEIIGTRVAGISTEGGDELFLKNTNKLLWSEEDLIGGKTGYTRKARHCFVCAAEREKETVVVALLGSPSRASLWRETEGLIGKGFQIMANKEEAVIFFTKADYDFLNVKKASYKKSEKLKAKSKKSKRKKTITKKKGKPKTFAKGKNKKAKNLRVAEKKENGNKG